MNFFNYNFSSKFRICKVWLHSHHFALTQMGLSYPRTEKQLFVCDRPRLLQCEIVSWIRKKEQKISHDGNDGSQGKLYGIRTERSSTNHKNDMYQVTSSVMYSSRRQILGTAGLKVQHHNRFSSATVNVFTLKQP